MSGSGIAQDQLRSDVERIERLEEEKSSIADDIKAVYAESKAAGFDTKILRKVIKLRKLSDEGGRMFQVGTRVLTKDEHKRGIGRRQCTSEYKLKPLTHKIRELLGVSRRGYIAPGTVECWVGISMDEIIRMRPARQKYLATRWPLIEEGLTRRDCKVWLRRNDYPIPPRSACCGCPFHNNDHWRYTRDHEPDEWADVIYVDKALRQGDSRGMRATEYMHADRVPLDEVDLSTEEDRGQIDLFNNECEGMCGV